MAPPFQPRYSLLLFILVCVLLSSLVAWVGIRWQPDHLRSAWEGFPPNTPRQDGFVEPGRLTFDVIEDVHGGNGIHVRLHVRIKLNHDRVFLHSIDNCVAEIRHMSYSLHDTLTVGDPTFVEEFVKRHLVQFNGTSSVESVDLISYQFDPTTPLSSRGIQPGSESSAPTTIGEQPDAIESGNISDPNLENRTGDR